MRAFCGEILRGGHVGRLVGQVTGQNGTLGYLGTEFDTLCGLIQRPFFGDQPEGIEILAVRRTLVPDEAVQAQPGPFGDGPRDFPNRCIRQGRQRECRGLQP